MNFSVIGEHRDFYRLNHWIECENLLSTAAVAKVNLGIAVTKSKTGRDLWRKSGHLKRVFLQRGLANIAADLIEYKPLRYGYDQYYDSASMLLPETLLSLLNISSIQGVLCGVMLCLKAPDEPVLMESSVFSQKPGHAIFFAPDFPIDFSHLKHLKGASYVLIVYATKNAVYCKQEKDLMGNEIKQLGYNFGDRLKDPFHPIVYE